MENTQLKWKQMLLIIFCLFLIILFFRWICYAGFPLSGQFHWLHFCILWLLCNLNHELVILNLKCNVSCFFTLPEEFSPLLCFGCRKISLGDNELTRVKWALVKGHVKGSFCHCVFWGIRPWSPSAPSDPAVYIIDNNDHPFRQSWGSQCSEITGTVIIKIGLPDCLTVNLCSHWPAGTRWATETLIQRPLVSMTETLIPIPIPNHNPVLGGPHYLLCF